MVSDVLVWIEMEPALPTFIFRTSVPSDRERLHAAIGKLDQVLLEGVDAERIFYLEYGQLAVWSVGLD